MLPWPRALPKSSFKEETRRHSQRQQARLPKKQRRANCSSFLKSNKLTSLGHRRFSFRLPFLNSPRHDGCFFSTERKWLRGNIKKFMMLNRRRNLHHSSHVRLPSVNKSAICFLVPTYLMWIFRSMFFLSNNQSNANLWVLDTCLITGLRPLMIILITASLSSKMYSCALH